MERCSAFFRERDESRSGGAARRPSRYRRRRLTARDKLCYSGTI